MQSTDEPHRTHV